LSIFDELERSAHFSKKIQIIIHTAGILRDCNEQEKQASEGVPFND